MLPFTDQVIQFIVLLLDSADENTVRAAIQADPGVMHFARSITQAERDNIIAPANRGDASTVENAVNTREEEEGTTQSFVVLCEFAARDGSASTVIATTKAATIFYLLSRNQIESREQLHQERRGAVIDSSAALDTTSMISQRKPLACVLISKRRTSSAKRSSEERPLSVKDLNIQSLDLESPLDSLQGLLQSVYDPMLKAQKTQVSLRVHVQDLMSSISATRQALPKVDILRFVPDDLIELCERLPNLDVPQLVDRLGDRARDQAYLRTVLQVRNRCNNVLPLESLLAGTATDANGRPIRETIGKLASTPGSSMHKAEGRVGGGAAASTGTGGRVDGAPGDGDDDDDDADEEDGWVVQNRIAYWQGVLAWIEEVLRQLQSREWRLVHRLLAHRVETSYAPEYVTYAQQVRDYIKFFQVIPEKQLATVAEAKFPALVEDIFIAVMKPTRYSPKLALGLLSGVVSEIVATLVRFMEARCSANVLSRTGAAAEGVSQGVETLAAIRRGTELLHELQKRYMSSTDTLRAQAHIIATGRREALQHPRIVVLLVRFAAVRDLVERHWLIIAQLHSVFSTRARLSGVAEQTEAVEAREALQNQYVALVQAAYDACENRIYGMAPDGVVSGTNEALANTLRGTITGAATVAQRNAEWGDVGAHVLIAKNIMWRTGAAAQRRFVEATSMYYAQVDRYDDAIALLVSDLLSSGQNMSPDAAAAVNGLVTVGDLAAIHAEGTADLGMRMFRTFATFRFLNLPKVQRVVQGYQCPVSEKISAQVKATQEAYFNMQVAKKQVRYAMARYHLSPMIAQIMWETHLERTLRECLSQWDYVAERGWHQLLSLRNIEYRWRLNSIMAEYIGFPLADLVTVDLQEDSEVHGCAYALAYLQLLFPEDATDWSADPHLHLAETIVRTQDSASLQAAKDRLVMLRAAHVAQAGRAQLREVRSTQAIIRKRVTEKVLAWGDAARQVVAQCHVDSHTSALRGPVYRVVEVPVDAIAPCGRTITGLSGGTGGGGASGLDAAAIGAGGTSRGVFSGRVAGTSPARGSSAGTAMNIVRTSTGKSFTPAPSEPFARPLHDVSGVTPAAEQSVLAIEVAFPEDLFIMADDVRYLHSISMLQPNLMQQEATATAVEFVKCNESRGKLARCLCELLRVYYTAVNGEDDSLVLLATDEYEDVNQCLARGFGVRWDDEPTLLQYVQELSEKVLNFTRVVQHVRGRMEAVYGKIVAFHVRAFHPEAIAQRVKEIRGVVDTLLLRCVNAYLWIRETQPLLDRALLAQMQFLLRGWTADFTSMRDDIRYLQSRAAETDVFHLRPLRVRMRVVYKEVKLETPASIWRHHWITELNKYFGWIYTLPKLYNDEDIRKNEISSRAARDIITLAHSTSGGTCTNGGGVGSATGVGAGIAASVVGGSGAVGSVGLGPGTSMVTMNVGTASGGIIQVSSSAGGVGGGDERGYIGYQYLLERLPASFLAEPLQAIEQCIQDAIAVEEEWQQSQQFLNLDVAVMQQRFGTDLRRWSTALHLMRRVSSQLMDFTQPNKLLGGIVIAAEDAQAELGRKLDQVSQYTHTKFKDVLELELDNTFRKISAERARADALDVISNVNDAAAFLCEVPRVKRVLAENEAYVTLMAEAEETLQQLGYVFPEHWTYASTVGEEYRSLKDLIERKMKALEFRRPFLADSVKQTSEEIDRRTRDLQKELATLDQSAAKNSPSAAQYIVSSLYDQVNSCREDAARLSALQEALGDVPYNTEDIERLSREVQSLKDVWGYVAQAYLRINALGAIPFFEMVPRRQLEDLQQLESEVEGYPEAIHGFAIYVDLVALVRRVIGYRRLMQDLRSDAMSPLERAQRHWQSLKQELHAKWSLEYLTVQEIWDSDPEANAVVYSGVLEMAQGERRIEVQLQSITSFWESFEFNVIAYKNQVVLIRGWDVVLERLAEDLGTFGGIRSSPYFNSQYVIAMTNESESRLNRLRQVLETLLEVQKRWVYLDGIFTGNVEIRTQLPHDTAQFDRTSRELIHILPRPRASGALPEVKAQFFLDDEKLLQTLERISAQLSATQRALTAYLDSQRRRFPRFFFVGDDDLLEILGNSNDPAFLAKHLKKMFTALSSFVLSKSGAITEFASATGEKVPFSVSVPYLKRPLHEWLVEAENGMSNTLRSRTIKAFEELTASANGVTLEWMTKYPAQAVCLAVQLWWVQIQESLWSPATAAAAKSGSTSGSPARSGATDAMDSLLERLATSVVSTDVTLALRYVCGQIITIAVYQRDVSRALAAKNVTSVEDFNWSRVLRLYQKKVTGVQVIECHMADAAVTHGFEYIGQYERLVQTALTDKAYLTLMQALHTRLGGSPLGPAGTGKTETVKALGLQLGRHVLVFNCDDTFDFQAMSRIFLGLCQVGAWGCFDEFNRLEERIISALSQQIELIQTSLRARKADIELGDHCVPLHLNVGIFITMNPGYAGRSKLPGNLKQLFRTVTMAVPDRETIAEVMLFAQGFQTAEGLARKVVPLFRLCEEQFSRQSHYDFGLRALKSVLVAAGARKRHSAAAATHSLNGSSALLSFSIGESDEDDGNDAQKTSEVSLADAECGLVLQSTIATVAPKLVTQDVSLFYPLLLDFFPGKELPDIKTQELRDAIADVCEETGLVATPHWVEKICQLHYTKETRHGVMIAGPSGTGKTTAWKALMSAMVRVDHKLEIQAYVVEPKVLSKGELFGTLDITTREWKDGIFTNILRRILDQELQPLEDVGTSGAGAATVATGVPAGGSPSPMPSASKGMQIAKGGASPTTKEYWIVFDGDVDPEWVENLNSVLDDNRILTLPNGERLSLPSSVRIFFEVQNLRYATPATVSRCGMLWFSEGILPLECVFCFARHQLRHKPLVDRRGRRMSWSLEDDLVGITSTTHAQQLTVADSVISGIRGKTYGHYIISNASPGLEMVLGSTIRYGSVTAMGSILNFNYNDEDQLLGGTRRDPSELYIPTGTLRVGGGFPSAAGQRHAMWRTTQPEASRMQERLMEQWSPEFEPKNGLVAKSLALMNSTAYRDACIMEYSTLQHLQSILALMLDGIWRAYLVERENDSGGVSGKVTDADWVKRVASKVLHHAVFWGSCAPLAHEDRIRLARDLIPGIPSVNGTPCSILDVELDFKTGEWKRMRDRVQTTEIAAQQIGANDTVIPTVDTCRHENMLTAWINAGRSAILCGPPGSGKTLTISAVLNNSIQYEGVFLNFSSGTSVDTVLKALEQYCETSNTARGLVMAPISGKKVLLFCDEINLPALDQYGTQVVLQLLRQIIERHGFFRPRDNVWITTEDIQVVGACNPPTDPGRVPLSLRFLRWAPVMLVGFPSPESLQVIYSSYCRAILAFHPTLLSSSASQLASAMVKVYTASQQHFTSAQQPHYLYSPRELTRWSRAIYEAILTLDEAQRAALTQAALVRLALHEGLRVFADRLVSSDEREWTDHVMDNSFCEVFPAVPKVTYDRPILFSALLTHAYTENSREEIRKYLQRRLDTFCEEEMSAPMVVFDSMIDHVVRIHRVLSQPLGHVLIAGSSGVGKTVIARLVAWMGGFFVTWLKVRRDYTLIDFEDDLRALLRRTGCKRERVCFIFDESNILQPSFLEYMNALLASGEVPGLFEGEEWTKLIQDVREAIVTNQSTLKSKTNDLLREGGAGGFSSTKRGGATTTASSGVAGTAVGQAASTMRVGAGGPTTASVLGAGRVNTADYVDISSEQDMYRWFLSNVREYLHVVFTINPSSSDFGSRAVASPALFNRCTIDWFGDWDEATIHQVTMERTRGVELLPSCPGVFATEEDAHIALARAVNELHLSTREINTALRARHANQGTFITPRHFTDFISHFVELTNSKAKDMVKQLQHLRTGLEKLHETATEVAKRKEELKTSEAAMAESSVKAQSMLERIVSETDVTRKEKAEAEKIRPGLLEQESALLADRQHIESELAEAEPALIAAEKALNTVKTDHLREIRAYTTPPPMVKRVLEAVCALMGEKNSDDWDILKNHIRRDDFLTNVKAFKCDDVTEAARERVTHMIKDKKFTVDAAYRASKAAGPLYQWVLAQLQYSEIFRRVAPMRAKIDKLVAAHGMKLVALRATEKVIAEKEVSLQQLMAEYQATTEQIATLKQRIVVVSAQCERATTITSQLIHERERWELEVKNFGKEARTTLGDCVLSAAFLSYIGFFDEFTREKVLVPKWAECISAQGIPTRSDLSVMEFLVAPSQRLAWERSGLPSDHLCMENAMIMDRSSRYTLLIDPAGTAAAFLQKFYSDKKIHKARFTKPGYLKELEMAVRFGYPILMEDAEFLDPAVGPLLNHEFRHTGSRSVARIGANDVDLSPTFKMFLLTRDPNYQPGADLAGQVCLVNFTVTLSSLQSQCLHRILLHERPDVDAKRTQLMRVQGEYQLRLRVLEQELLTCIASSQGSLLDDDQLIVSLTKLKDESRTITEDIGSSEESMQLIERVEGRYRPVSAVAARIYFALKRFDELSTFYRFNVGFMFRILEDALASLPPRDAPMPSVAGLSTSGARPVSEVLSAVEDDNRLARITAALFALVHKRVMRGMFRGDHLVLGLRLAQLRSAVGDETAGAIAEIEWDWLLDGLRAAPLDATAVSASAASSSSVVPTLLEKLKVAPAGRQARAAFSTLLRKPAFSELRLSLSDASHETEWTTFLTSFDPVQNFSALGDRCFKKPTPLVRKMFLLTLMLYYTRRESFVSAAYALLQQFFDGHLVDDAKNVTAPSLMRVFGNNSVEDLHDITTMLPELGPSTPVLMVSNASVDPSVRVEQVAHAKNVQLHTVALGSGEGTADADRYLSEAMATGGWVLLKNVHLARAYMNVVEKRLHTESMENMLHEGFQLFLTVDRDAVEGDTRDLRKRDSDASSGGTALPINLLEDSVVVVFEAQPGIKACLIQTYGALEKIKKDTAGTVTTTTAALNPAAGTLTPAGTSHLQRVYLVAAWLHAVVIERLFYVPIGWSEMYEYSDTEFARVVQAVDAWVRKSGDSIELLWPCLQAIVTSTIYGGRISNNFDQHVMDTLCATSLDASALAGDHVFARKAGMTSSGVATAANSQPPLLRADIQTRDAIVQWIGLLPNGYSNPQWLGLPAGASYMLLSRQAQDTLERLSSIQMLMKEEALATSTTEDSLAATRTASKALRAAAAEAAKFARTRWSETVETYCKAWAPPIRTSLEALEKDTFVSKALASSEARRSQEVMSGLDAVPTEHASAQTSPAEQENKDKNVSAPLSLAVQREVVVAVHLLRCLAQDVKELREVCAEKRTPSSAHRMLIEELMKGRVPDTWATIVSSRRSSTASCETVAAWMSNTLVRAEHTLHLARAVTLGTLSKVRVSLGLLFSPGAFLTASKQQHARLLCVSLEQLQPHVELLEESALETRIAGEKSASALSGALFLDSMTLFGASVNAQGQSALLHTAGASSAVAAPLFTRVGIRWTWQSQTSTESAAAAGKRSVSGPSNIVQKVGYVAVPLYVNDQRDEMLEIVNVKVAASESADCWYERGVCLAAWVAVE